MIVGIHPLVRHADLIPKVTVGKSEKINVNTLIPKHLLSSSDDDLYAYDMINQVCIKGNVAIQNGLEANVTGMYGNMYKLIERYQEPNAPHIVRFIERYVYMVPKEYCKTLYKGKDKIVPYALRHHNGNNSQRSYIHLFGVDTVHNLMSSLPDTLDSIAIDHNHALTTIYNEVSPSTYSNYWSKLASCTDEIWGNRSLDVVEHITNIDQLYVKLSNYSECAWSNAIQYSNCRSFDIITDDIYNIMETHMPFVCGKGKGHIGDDFITKLVSHNELSMGAPIDTNLIRSRIHPNVNRLPIPNMTPKTNNVTIVDSPLVTDLEGKLLNVPATDYAVVAIVNNYNNRTREFDDTCDHGLNIMIPHAVHRLYGEDRKEFSAVRNAVRSLILDCIDMFEVCDIPVFKSVKFHVVRTFNDEAVIETYIDDNKQAVHTLYFDLAISPLVSYGYSHINRDLTHWMGDY